MNKVYRVRHIKPSVQKERSRRAIPLLIAGIIVLATSGIFVLSQNVQAMPPTPLFSDNFEQPGNSRANKWVPCPGCDDPNPDARVSTSDNGFTVRAGASGKGLLLEATPHEGAEREIATKGYGTLNVSYSRAIHGIETGDNFVASYSLDDGAFTTIETLTANQTHSVKSITIDNSDRHTKLTLRFKINGNNEDDEVGIDNVSVTGENPPLFHDGFESGNFTTGGWTQTNSPSVQDEDDTQIWTDNNLSTLGHAAELDGQSGSPDDAITKSFSTAGYQNIKVRYAREVENLDSDEGLRVGYSTDGTSFTDLETRFVNDSYDSVSFPLPIGASNNPNFKLRFDVVASSNSEDSYVDDVVIWGDLIPASTGSISGMKFNDLNGNSTNDQEPVLAGWTINLYSNDNPWTLVQSATTSQDGSYAFSNLTDGTYYVCEVPQQGWSQTEPTQHPGTRLCEGGEGTIGYSVSISGGQSVTEKNFGNWQPPTGSISGMKFEDVDMSRTAQEQGETGLGGWTIQLYSSNNPWTFATSTVTDQNGDYSFQNLADGTYYICEVFQQDWWQTYPDSGTSCQNGRFSNAAVVSGGNPVPDMDFGNYHYGRISGYKFNDLNGNGIIEQEPGLVGWTIYLDRNQNGQLDGSEASVLTDQNGYYEFIELEPETYYVREVTQSGWRQTYPAPGTGHDVIIQSGTVSGPHNFGNQQLGSITIVKYANPDGQFSIGVSGPQWSESVMLGNNGSSTFSNLVPGDYTVSETVPDGWSGQQSVMCEQVPGIDSATFTLAPGQDAQCIFNNTEYGAIGGTKFEDEIANGALDGEDNGLAEWNIDLYRVGTGLEYVTTASTNAFGNYFFGNLAPDTYAVCEALQEGWTQSYPTAGEGTAQCPRETIGHQFYLGAGETVTNKNFGNWRYGSVSGIKFHDLNGNGWNREEGEPLLADWTIQLWQQGDEQPLLQMLTAQDGSYLFTDLQPGVTYGVHEILPEGWVQTMPGLPNYYYTIDPMHSGWDITQMDFANVFTVVDAPVADPASGTYQEPVDVTLTANASYIYYNLGGPGDPAPEPSCGSGTLYSNPIHLAQDAGIRAIACNEAGYGSPVTAFNYVIGWPRSTGGSWFPEVLGESTTTEEEGGGAQGELATSTATSTPPEEEGTGEVLGEQTCSEYLTNYLWYGRSNDATQVEKLQSFMNEHMQSGLPVTGFFGNLTRGAVRGFQLKYADEVLKPWTDLFGGTYEDTASGNVYKTTKWKINMLKCPALNLTLPLLP